MPASIRELQAVGTQRAVRKPEQVWERALGLGSARGPVGKQVRCRDPRWC